MKQIQFKFDRRDSSVFEFERVVDAIRSNLDDSNIPSLADALHLPLGNVVLELDEGDNSVLRIYETGVIEHELYSSIVSRRRESSCDDVVSWLESLFENGWQWGREQKWYRPEDLPPVDFLYPDPIPHFQIKNLYAYEIEGISGFQVTAKSALKNLKVIRELPTSEQCSSQLVDLLLDYDAYGGSGARCFSPGVCVTWGRPIQNIRRQYSLLERDVCMFALLCLNCQWVYFFYSSEVRKLPLAFRTTDAVRKLLMAE